MRTAGLLLLASLALAGCASSPGSPPGNATNATAMAAALPPAIHETQAVQGSVDPPNVPACSQATTQCFHHPFQLNASASINATLTWGLDRNDFDLYLFKGTERVASSNGGSGTKEEIGQTLAPGAYDLVVGGTTVAADTYKLDAVFAAPP